MQNSNTIYLMEHGNFSAQIEMTNGIHILKRSMRETFKYCWMLLKKTSQEYSGDKNIVQNRDRYRNNMEPEPDCNTDFDKDENTVS